MTNQRRGRQHARPRTARRVAHRAELKEAGRAERRGRRVSPTVAGFEAAFRDGGYDGIAEALIARHNQRMVRIVDVGDVMQRIGLPLLTSYLPLSLASEELGANCSPPPPTAARRGRPRSRSGAARGPSRTPNGGLTVT
jgi:hypothetical protein